MKANVLESGMRNRGMCTDMYTNMHVDMHVDMHADMHADMPSAVRLSGNVVQLCGKAFV